MKVLSVKAEWLYINEFITTDCCILADVGARQPVLNHV